MKLEINDQKIEQAIKEALGNLALQAELDYDFLEDLKKDLDRKKILIKKIDLNK